MTANEQLEEINRAISAVLSGAQQYKIGSRSVQRADLKQLYAMKNDLMGQVAAENTGGLLDDCYVAIFDSR